MRAILLDIRNRQTIMGLEQAASPPKVLVVEDEMMLRMRAVEIVEDAGFIPIEAVNADEALAILESRSDIDLLFTDIQMPGSMDGLKLAHAVHERWPSIKIILVSGKLTPTEAESILTEIRQAPDNPWYASKRGNR